MKAPTYIELSKLENFYSIDPYKNITFLQNYLVLKSILEKRCHLLFNNVEELEQKIRSNPNLKKLYKSGRTGSSTIGQYIFSESINSVLLSFKEASNVIEFDCDNLDYENEELLTEITKIEEYNISKDSTNTFKGWNNLKIKIDKINGLIIEDPYIFKNKSSIHNLSQIINSLSSNERTIDICIFINTDNTFEDSEKKLEFLKTRLENKNHNLSLFRVSGPKSHDRNIISNYFRIGSGRSFDYYNDSGILNQETILNINGVVSNDTSVHFLLIKKFKTISEKSKENFDRIGNGKNKLFDYIA